MKQLNIHRLWFSRSNDQSGNGENRIQQAMTALHQSDDGNFSTRRACHALLSAHAMIVNSLLQESPSWHEELIQHRGSGGSSPLPPAQQWSPNHFLGYGKEVRDIEGQRRRNLRPLLLFSGSGPVGMLPSEFFIQVHV